MRRSPPVVKGDTVTFIRGGQRRTGLVHCLSRKFFDVNSETGFQCCWVKPDGRKTNLLVWFEDLLDTSTTAWDDICW